MALFLQVSFHSSIDIISIGAQAIGGNQLTTVTVSESNPAYTAVDNVLFTKDMTTVVLYPGGKSDESYQVPDGITTIGAYAFYSTGLTSLYIPDSVTTVGEYAMYSFYGLASAYFYGDVPESWGENVFYGSEVTIYYINGKNGWTTPTWTDLNGKTYTTATWNP